MSEEIFRAVNSIAEALKGLSLEEQQRTLDGVALLLGLQRTARVTELTADVPRTTSSTTAKPLSVVEFIKEWKPKNAKEYIATFALYRQQIEGADTFSPRELCEYFEKAKLKSPGKNFARDFGKAVKAGWIAGNGERSYLTQAGERAVESRFSDAEP
jgi:hypothetical protein